MLALLATFGCGGDGGGDDGPCSGDPCAQEISATLDSVSVDGSGGTTVVSFSSSLDSPASASARVNGWVLECRYLSPDASMLRGSGAVDLTVPACDEATLSDPGTVPGVLHWEGAPTGDDLRCILDVSYMIEGCDPDQARVSVTGSSHIAVTAP